jgi:glutathione peroxidase-family protein
MLNKGEKMKKVTKVFILAVLLVMSFSVVGFADVKTNEKAPDFSLSDSNGTTHNLSDYRGKYVVLEWINFQCPFVVKHYKSGNMQGLQKKHTQKDVVWLSIGSSASGKQGNYSPEEINEIVKNSNAAPTAYLIDEQGTVGRAFGAKTTPHMFVVNPEGHIVYQGAIDSISSFDSEDIPEATNYIDLALHEAMAGGVLSNSTTKSYGCSVKY